MNAELVYTARLTGKNIYCFKVGGLYIIKIIGLPGSATVIITSDCRVERITGSGLSRQELESIVIRVKQLLVEKRLLHCHRD